MKESCYIILIRSNVESEYLWKNLGPAQLKWERNIHPLLPFTFSQKILSQQVSCSQPIVN